MPIEQNVPELERIVSAGQNIEKLGDGYGGGDGPAEGPLWWKEGSYLLFSDIHNNRRMKWAQGQGVTLFQEPTNRANGLTRDLQGRLLAAEHDSRRVTRQEPDGSITVVANSFKGQRLNRPNDVIVKSDGAIYFTDPWTSPLPREQWDLTFSGVYRVTPDLGTITLLVDDFIVPNGLMFSPDESILYINDSLGLLVRDDMFRSLGRIDAFDVRANGMLANRRVFCELRGEQSGIPDGMKVDVKGNVYCTGPGGVWVMDATGKHLGTILTGVEHATNMAWGGEDWKTQQSFIGCFGMRAQARTRSKRLPVIGVEMNGNVVDVHTDPRSTHAVKHFGPIGKKTFRINLHYI